MFFRFYSSLSRHCLAVPVVCCLSLMLINCSSYDRQQHVAQPVNITVNIAEPARLRFSGKGTVAGMALASAMGAAGTAVGISIDEGIGRDIEKQLTSAKYDFKSELRSAIETSLHGLCCLSEEIEITVERYGFKAYGKADFPDPISAELKLIVKYGDHNHFSFDYPGQYDINLPLMPLEKARSDAEAAAMGLANAIVLVAQNVRMKLSERG